LWQRKKLKDKMTLEASKRASTRLSARISERRSGFKLNNKIELLQEKQEINNDQSFKIAIVGNSKAGKTCIAQQFYGDIFINDHEETIEDMYGKKFEVALKNDLIVTYSGDHTINCNLQIVDTQGRRAALTYVSEDSISQCHGVMLVLSVTDMESYTTLMDFYDDVQRMQPGITTILVATKCDAASDQIVVSDKEINLAAAAIGAPVIKVSSATKHNIDECFELLVNEILIKKYLTVPTGLEHLIGSNLEGKRSLSSRLSQRLSKRLSRKFCVK
jgi:small GTP-binding protein